MPESFSDYEIRMYVADIRDAGVLDEEIVRVRGLMVDITRDPNEDKGLQRQLVTKVNQMFKGLLTEKARQESLKKVRDDNSSNAQDGGTRVAHDPRPRIRIWNILK